MEWTVAFECFALHAHTSFIFWLATAIALAIGAGWLLTPLYQKK